MNENLNKMPRAYILIKWIMFTAAVTSMAIVAAFYPIKGNLPLIVVPSILVLLLAKPVFFEKMKLNTLVVMRILVVFAAIDIFPRQLYVNIILWMLVVNILEATFTDLLRHKKYFNAVSGFAVAIGVFTLSGMWAYGAPIGNYYIVGGVLPIITICYVAAYTIWNWIFVTNEFSPSVALMHVGILSAPLIGGLLTAWMGPYGGLTMWLILRANSLSIGGWMQIGAKPWFEKEFADEGFSKFVDGVHKTSVQVVLMVINLALIGTCIYYAYATGTIALPSLAWQ